MARIENSGLNFESIRDKLNLFFEKQLSELELDEDRLKRQKLDELKRSLTIINQAIEHHESFGKFSLKVSAQGDLIVAQSNTESHFAISILPLLLERKQVILQRIEKFTELAAPAIARKAEMKAELFRMAQAEINRKLWLVILVLVAFWVSGIFLIRSFGWDTLEPWTYLFGVAMFIAGYIYFAVRQQEFSPYTIYHNALDARLHRFYEVFDLKDEPKETV